MKFTANSCKIPIKIPSKILNKILNGTLSGILKRQIKILLARLFLWLAAPFFYSHVYIASTAPAVFIIILRYETSTASAMAIYQSDNLVCKTILPYTKPAASILPYPRKLLKISHCCLEILKNFMPPPFKFYLRNRLFYAKIAGIMHL